MYFLTKKITGACCKTKSCSTTAVRLKCKHKPLEHKNGISVMSFVRPQVYLCSCILSQKCVLRGKCLFLFRLIGISLQGVTTNKQTPLLLYIGAMLRCKEQPQRIWRHQPRANNKNKKLLPQNRTKEQHECQTQVRQRPNKPRPNTALLMGAT